ncbi:MAG: Gfo/Idh/MocA family oxidoreductase [Rickettsiales bacterium]|nr:Gfo/Idh/MocA family oxidoreductase [Rickettsiales bacterium]
MKNKLRVAIIGFGMRGKRIYAQALNLTETIEVVAICNRSPIVVENNDSIQVYVSYVELLDADLDLDFIILSTPHTIHQNIIKLAASRGIHVLKEKPFALSKSEADYYLKLRKKYGVIINSFPPRMIMEKTRYMMNKLPQIGKVSSINIEYNMYIKDPFAGWRGSYATSGGGCIADQGFHMIHMLHWLFDAPERLCVITNLIKKPPISLRDPTEHTANIQFAYLDGKHGNIMLSRCHGSKYEGFKIMGESGIIEMINDKVFLRTNSGDLVESYDFIEPKDLPIQKQLEYFVDVLSGAINDHAALKCNVASVSFMEAAYKSSNTNSLIYM